MSSPTLNSSLSSTWTFWVYWHLFEVKIKWLSLNWRLDLSIPKWEVQNPWKCWNSQVSFFILRLCKTAITWLRSLSAILPLFWRYAIAELHHLCREDSRNVLWRHEICDVFPRIMTCALQNMQFSQYFTTKFNIFSLNLTGESVFFILFSSTHNKLSMSSFL